MLVEKLRKINIAANQESVVVCAWRVLRAGPLLLLTLLQGNHSLV